MRLGVVRGFALVAGALIFVGGCGRGGASPAADDALARSSTSSTSTALASATPGVTVSATAHGSGQATGTLVTPGVSTPTPTPTPLPPAASGTIVITDRDNGATVPVRAGSTVAVRLSSTGGPYRWTEPVSSDDTILHRTIASTADDGSSAGTFVGERSGRATLEASDDPHCTPACGAPSRLWAVTVVVSP